MDIIANKNNADDQAVLVYSPHPLLPAADRQIIFAPFYDGESITYYLNRHNIFISPHIKVKLFLGGVYVPREMWPFVKPKFGHVITIRGYASGGGGGGKNPFATIATLALGAFAPVAVGALGFTAGTAAFSLVTAGIRLAGSLLVSAIFPPSTPSGITNRSIANEQVSPTYSISASSNRARLFEPMVLILGTHIIYPDLGALPYTTFEGDDQFLYQVLHFGLTDITLTDIKIGQTTTDQYSDVTTEFSTLDSGALTLFPVNTESTLGATLSNAASWITRTGGTNATGLRIEFSGSLFSTNTETGSTESFNLDLQAQYRISGSADPWLAFTGDVDGNFTITSSSRKAVRRSYFISVSSGQYEVRVRQTSSDTLPTNANSQMEWVQLLTMQPDTADYSDQLRMAIRIKASGQLNGNLDQLNAIASARIPVWNGVTEVIQASSNPGHQFIWLARGKTDGNGRRLYGAGLSDSQIDLDGLREWADWCGTNNLQCNLVFDTPTSVNDMLVTVARCGRASPSWASGKLGVIYDKKNLPIIQIFGMNNIKQGSFQVEYVTENLADEVVVTFINPSLDWKPDTVRVSVPGADNPKNSASVQILGITSSTQAAREANLLASRQYYHRRKITWQTDAEGFVCNRGDVVALAHNLTSWANSGRLVTGSTDAILYLDQDIIFTDDTPVYNCEVA
jgi:hypothetical protein